ncbi:MAG TPA: tRNA uridine-5-carboxymethylaminomethyl(34) synthesis GTPase MnmE [Bacteroidales bacterium]|nr:tRNA uridine-5-carboxymethylaminomethyl(34) synthesis GTPase MnmE [Bacteroidales bacterium]HPS16310.1 tRNA uridine-5-carboxymethylaminomethyl(34) synthesis GTPase MnmE [Bacteroidales bacterium]
MLNEDTICAVSTPFGTGAISIIRLSGKDAFGISEKIWKSKNSNLHFNELKYHHAYLGNIFQEENIFLDEAIITLFKSPESFTTEDVVEFSCHGSIYIQHQLLQLLIRNGARAAQPGEFSLRAFLNGRIDLTQAEAIADLISSTSQSAHRLAIQQMRGGFSNEIKVLRSKLLNFSSMLELELDFSEEDVEFANRDELKNLLLDILSHISNLLESYKFGNIIKTGIPVTIVGKPNVGKSTLLNILLDEDKAIVTDIPGTTRDAIEDVMVIQGIAFRFIDTAGLREATDMIENMGIEKTYEKIEKASIVLYMFDINESSVEEIKTTITDFNKKYINQNKKLIVVANKTDILIESPKGFKDLMDLEPIFISAKRGENINILVEKLTKYASEELNNNEGNIITNSRHYESLHKAHESISRSQNALTNNSSTEFIASDIRTALHYLAEITGEVTTEEILGNIFSKFCIGK